MRIWEARIPEFRFKRQNSQASKSQPDQISHFEPYRRANARAFTDRSAAELMASRPKKAIRPGFLEVQGILAFYSSHLIPVCGIVWGVNLTSQLD